MKKQIVLWINILLLLALLTGCTLARPEGTDASVNGQEGAFCGFWLLYDRWENEESHVFDMDSDTEQVMLAYMLMPGEDRQELAHTTKTGSSVTDVSSSLNFKDDGVEIELKGTIYVLEEGDQEILEQEYREIWLNGDAVQSFRDMYLEPPEGMDGEGTLKPGETLLIYIPQEQIDKNGRILKDMAEQAGVHLILKSESPRQLKVVSVYQRPDGTVYANEGGVRFMLNGTGSSFTQTVENTQTVNGKLTKRKLTATVSAQKIDRLMNVRLVEMNDQNNVLRAADASLSDIQSWAKAEKSFIPGKDCAYLIVEETYQILQGETYMKRTTYSRPPKADTIKPLHVFHFPKENGLTETAYMNIGF